MLKNKSKGFYMTAATLLLTILGIIFFALLTKNAFDSAETPTIVFAAAAATAVLCLATALKDIFKLFSWASFVMATVTFFTFLSGRISYVAFFLSGDVMGTGMSPFFMLTAVCFLGAMILSIAAMSMEQVKG